MLNILINSIFCLFIVIDKSSEYDDTTYAGAFDDLEAFHTDPFTISDSEDLSTPVIVEDDETELKESLPETPQYQQQFDHSQQSLLKYYEKMVTLCTEEIDNFNQALKIDQSYPQNVLSMSEMENKLMESRVSEIFTWPDIYQYRVDKFSKFWAKVCVVFWDKQLDRTHRQACKIKPSFGSNKARRLYVAGQTQYIDLLFCRCHSYKINHHSPESAKDTFLIHKISENEFLLFKQTATNNSKYTLFLKGFKGGIHLPDPEKFNKPYIPRRRSKVKNN